MHLSLCFSEHEKSASLQRLLPFLVHFWLLCLWKIFFLNFCKNAKKTLFCKEFATLVKKYSFFDISLHLSLSKSNSDRKRPQKKYWNQIFWKKWFLKVTLFFVKKCKKWHFCHFWPLPDCAMSDFFEKKKFSKCEKVYFN